MRAYTYTNCERHGFAFSYPYTYTNTDAIGFTVSNTNTDPDTYGNTVGYPDFGVRVALRGPAVRDRPCALADRVATALRQGGWHGLAAGELCKLLRDTRHGFVSYVNQLPEETGNASSSFGIFKDMTPHDWLFVVSVHAATHLVQVREMKARPDFPQ